MNLIQQVVSVCVIAAPFVAMAAPSDLTCPDGSTPVLVNDSWRCEDGSLAISGATLKALPPSDVGGGAVGLSFGPPPDSMPPGDPAQSTQPGESTSTVGGGLQGHNAFPRRIAPPLKPTQPPSDKQSGGAPAGGTTAPPQ